MRIYFARHGKTRGNTERFIPPATESLDETGREEATLLASRLAAVPLQHVFSSDYSRAKETAAQVATERAVPHSVLPELNELQRGADLQGRYYADKETKRLLDAWWKGLDTKEHETYAEETGQETFSEFKARCEKALQFLQEQPLDTIGVVTHSATLRMLLGLIVFKEAFTPALFRDLFFNLDMRTTGISVAEYIKERGWRMLVWNDCTHLADPK